MTYKSSLGTAQGLGSAKSGSGHWWLQRVTAFLLIPLTYWLIMLIHLSINTSFIETVSWLSAPLNTVCVTAWLLAVLYHAALGIQVVIEDYVSTEWLKIVSVWTVNIIFFFMGLLAITAIFRIISAG